MQKTGRVITVHEAQLSLGLGAELAARISEQCFYLLGGAGATGCRLRHSLSAEPASRTSTFLILIGCSIWSIAHWPTEGEARMALQTFRLPDPGEGLVEADIVTWRVAVGDQIKINDILLEVETSKSLVELPSPYAGTVTELLVERGRHCRCRYADHLHRRRCRTTAQPAAEQRERRRGSGAQPGRLRSAHRDGEATPATRQRRMGRWRRTSRLPTPSPLRRPVSRRADDREPLQAER